MTDPTQWQDLSLLAQPRIGLYMLTSGPQVMFVGKTTDLLTAIAYHLRHWPPGTFTGVRFLSVRPSEQNTARAKLIAEFHPPLNAKQRGHATQRAAMP